MANISLSIDLEANNIDFSPGMATFLINLKYEQKEIKKWEGSTFP